MADREAKSQHFIANGRQNACVAIEPMVRTEVEAEYAEQLKGASLWRRFWIHRKMKQEIRRRIGELAPPDALYETSGRAPSRRTAHST